MARPADVERVIFPPEPPRPPKRRDDLLQKLLGYYGSGTVDELIDLIIDDSNTYRVGPGGSIGLNLGYPTAVLTMAGNLVVFSDGIGGVATVSDIVLCSATNPMAVCPGLKYLDLSGRIQIFSEDAAFVTGVRINLSNGHGGLDTLPSGEGIIVVFRIPAHMLGHDISIMWWDESRGMWREIDFIRTSAGRCIAITKLTGAFALIAK